jgi:hypothetical protein
VDNEAVGQVKQNPIARKKTEIVVLTRERMSGIGEYRFSFYGIAVGPPFPPTAKMIWHPPERATNFKFVDPEPEPGGPPFVWNLPVDPVSGSTPFCTVFYNDGSSPLDEVHTFTMQSGGQETTKSITYSLPDLSASPVQSTQRLAASAPHPALQDDYYLWMNILWIRPEGSALTTSLCQGYADLLQSESTFFALRFPVQPPTLAYTEPYTLPVVFRGSYSPTLSLVQLGPYSEIFAASLEYRPQYHTFAENELPATPGERWLALGVASTPTITCPQGLDVASGDWLFEPRFYLDFGGVQDTCADCVLPLYYCYKGQELPVSLAQLRGDVTSYQGWGITCLGPHPLRLETPSPTTPPFVLGGRHAAYITATQTISFSHHVMNRGSVPVTVTLDYTSELGLNWGIYEDAAGQVPLVGPVALATGGPERIRYFWMIADVPEGTPSGAESLIITAADTSSPALSTWTSDVLWVGDWVEPPPPPMPYKLYLPLVLRESP